MSATLDRYEIGRTGEPAARPLVQQLMHELIVDYADPETVELKHQLAQIELDELFADSETTPDAAIYVVAIDRLDGSLVGAAIVETPIARVVQADSHGVSRASRQAYSSFHRILGAIAVAPAHRGEGLGSGIVDDAAIQALLVGARYLDGFVEHRTGSAGFYEAAGLIVTPHNTPLPPRPPVNFTSRHLHSADGRYFGLDLWERYAAFMSCAICSGPLWFDRRDGGRLVCDNCLGGS